MRHIYDTFRWRRVRVQALARDGEACTVSRLLGGSCSGPLHVHHLIPVRDGGDPYDLANVATACASHHPAWESLRRQLVRARAAEEGGPPRCTHYHRTAEARRLCERELARRRGVAA
jgi:5-methylcytosine-specific restriction endonuclease McrA